MKMQPRFAAAVLFTIAVNSGQPVFAQGSLTPPGAPAPTMKSLDQLQPRIPISTAPYTISSPGSYYLTTNLTVASGDAIDIATNGVTLDLGGYAISSTSGGISTYAISLGRQLRNIVIMNGIIQSSYTNNGAGLFTGYGFGYGIYYNGGQPSNVRVSKVNVSGCYNYGINLGGGGSSSTLVESCEVQSAGTLGIAAETVRSCSVADCGQYAIDATEVSDSYAQSVRAVAILTGSAINCSGYSSTNYGIQASSVHNCYGSSTVAAGIHTTTAENSIGVSSTGMGIMISVPGTALNCVGSSLGGIGIDTADGCVLNGCTANSSGVGINTGNRCTIVNCTTLNNFTNGIVAGQSCVVKACTSGNNGTSAVGVGITVGIRSSVEGCTVTDNVNDGILAAGDCTVLNNHSSHNGVVASASGIHMTGTGSRVDGNQTRDNSGYGIQSDGGAGADVIVRNTAGGNGLGSYSVTSGATFAPVQSPSSMTNALGNISF